ncbi:hypothetical protein HUJ04_007635 [Dendroctonus ponderosae]|uniref:Protein-lysine N-methyltransferase SMYD4 n=1 Tax=Dendroctonus ponderosae TaxID=77166 RepID=A0AAR5QB86_DENPD|nr:hypothetical protein HUJ04_007635 [Dendroctonus ponderosae]
MAADQRDLNKQLIERLQAENIILPISREFAQLETNENRVNFVYDLLKTKDLLPPLIRDAKNDTESTKYRNQGNNMFIQAKHKEAHQLYTKSLALAEPGSLNVALAYGNRSAVLFKKKLYGECLKDAHRALENNYPINISPKLIKRIAEAERLLSASKTICFYKPMPEISEKNSNALIQSAANSVKVEYSGAFGRYVVATRDLEPGEIIAVEKAFCSILESKVHIYCHHCLKLCYSLIPCLNCTQALFCSTACQSEANKQYHQYECPIVVSVRKLDETKMLHLKLTIVVRDKYKSLDQCKLNPDEIYRSDRYEEIFNLVANTSSRSISDLFSRATSAAGYFHLMKEHTNFFHGETKDCEGVFKELLLFHMQIGPCNFHQISSRLSTVGDADWTLGSAAYSFLSLFNHSCFPNVSRYEYGSVAAIFTIRSIRKGEQCFENYGQHYALMSKADRQAKLKKQYYFDCNCEACLNDYGMYNCLPVIGGSQQSAVETFQLLQSGSLIEAEKAVPKMIKEIRRTETKMPNQELGEFQEALKQCFFIFSTLETPI